MTRSAKHVIFPHTSPKFWNHGSEKKSDLEDSVDDIDVLLHIWQMVDHCNKDRIWGRNNVESTLHNASDKELLLEFSLRWGFKSDSISLWTNQIASLNNHFETSLIHDAVLTMPVCRKQQNQIYIHEHGKKAETLQVKIFYSMSTFFNWGFFQFKVLMGSRWCSVTGDPYF